MGLGLGRAPKNVQKKAFRTFPDIQISKLYDQIWQFQWQSNDYGPNMKNSGYFGALILCGFVYDKKWLYSIKQWPVEPSFQEHWVYKMAVSKLLFFIYPSRRGKASGPSRSPALQWGPTRRSCRCRGWTFPGWTTCCSQHHYHRSTATSGYTGSRHPFDSVK